MAAGLENLMWSQDSAVNLEHVLLKDKVLTPFVDDCCLKSTTRRTIVEQTTNTAVDLERGGIKHATSEDRFEDGLVKGLALEGGRAGSHGDFVALLRLLQLKSVEGSRCRKKAGVDDSAGWFCAGREPEPGTKTGQTKLP
ncbi:hypothetical protein HG530_003071 [Fusarium avenaceum]|nr:hypothetical protein HG530_003071 [Fusarium avenaceum]